MKTNPQRRHETLTQPTVGALLSHLLAQRSPVRTREARERLSLSPNEFAMALRALERLGLAKRLRHASRSPGPVLNGHLFIEATEQALSANTAPTSAGMPSQLEV